MTPTQSPKPLSEHPVGTFLELRDLAKSFGEQRVLEGLSLDLEEGEVLALLGLSGSGKTTALRLLAGFENPDEGTIRVAGEDVARLPPARRGFGMVFQHYALFPHMTVAENVAFGLQSQGWDKTRQTPRVAEMLTLVDLAGFGGRRVSEISGGQQQRVALARALAPEPRVLLLDEPLSNLDPSLRERTREELRAAVKRIGITTVLVTHEQEEAFHVGDRVAVLHGGRLQQLGTPQDLYHRPATRFVATFVGRASVVPGILDEASSSDGQGQVSLEVAPQTTPTRWPVDCPERVENGAAVEVVVKPEGLALALEEVDGALLATVQELRFTGALTYCRAELAMGSMVEILVAGPGEPVPALNPGDSVWVVLRQDGPRPRAFAPESV